MAKVAERILNDEEFAIKYIWNESRRAQKKLDSCDEACRRSYYCKVSCTE